MCTDAVTHTTARAEVGTTLLPISSASSALSIGVVAGAAIGSALMVCTVCIVILLVIFLCYHRSERPHVQTVQLSRIASTTPGTASETPALTKETEAGDLPPSYATVFQHYIYSRPRESYEMHKYPPPANPTAMDQEVEPHYW